MNVKLIAYTQPAEEITNVNPLSVAELAASICYDSDPTENFRIAKGCMNSGHMSVMEHISFTFLVSDVSRALLAQLSRHRHISLSVRSQRYCREDEFGYVNINNTMPEQDTVYTKAMEAAQDHYNDLIALGTLPEDARMVLPNACCTELAITANARSLIEMANLRLCTRAQKEIRDMFTMMKHEVEAVCPEVAKKMVPQCEKNEKHPFCTERTSCGRHKKLCDIYKEA